MVGGDNAEAKLPSAGASRARLGNLVGLIKNWRSNGGDKARAEYQDALAAAS
jgi:hypothetical protein